MLVLFYIFIQNTESRTQILDQKYYFQPATGFRFFCLKNGFAEFKDSEAILC
jgi:hypothetical protein